MMMPSLASRLTRRICPIMIALLCLCGCSLGAPNADLAAPSFAGSPRIVIASPLDGQTFAAGATVIIQARIENAGPDLARIAVLLDGAVIGEKGDLDSGGAAIVPLSLDWLASQPGRYDIAVEAARAAGDAGSDSVSIVVISQEAAQESAGQAVDQEATPRPATELPPPTSAFSLPARVITPANLRRGPGTYFALAQSLDVDAEVRIVAVNPAREWLRVRHDELAQAWVYAEALAVEGDLSQLPVEPGPRRPGTADGWINLLIEAILLEPNPLRCDEPGVVIVTIRNEGDTDTTAFASLILQDTLASTGERLGDPLPAVTFPYVQAGASVNTNQIPFRVSARADAEHELIVTIDSGDAIAESDEADNVGSLRYQLERGDCP